MNEFLRGDDCAHDKLSLVYGNTYMTVVGDALMSDVVRSLVACTSPGNRTSGGDLVFERPLEWVVNDGLMVIFLFVVGMEIRREIHCGELSHWRRAALPAAGALGGMLAPAALYVVIAGAPATRSGWGVPMATDIAFAVGILTLLGNRVPAALRVLLLALAVIDDLGAIVVIALFYSSSLAGSGLLVAAAGFGAVLVMQRVRVRAKFAYVPPSLIAWAGINVATGVAVGLIVGKPAGVLLACGLALKLRLARLPKGVTPRHLLVLGVVAGVGFTMALFIADLASSDAQLLAAGKLGFSLPASAPPL